MKNESQISIFKFSDYREFLAQYYVSKKSKNSSYSHRVFAQQAGLSSPSHLLMIIKGERNLSQKTIPKFSEGLNLQNRERQYFELLVLYNQTNDLQLKAKYFSQMMTLKSALNQLTPLEKEKFEFLSKWYIVAIYVLIDLREFIADHQWIAKRLGGKVTIAQVK